MPYHPERGEVVTVERFRDIRPIMVKITSVRGFPGDEHVIIGFVRMDGVPETGSYCLIEYIIATTDSSKEREHRQFREMLLEQSSAE